MLTPIASAARSSSRMATQPRPMRLLLSRVKTRMTNMSSSSSEEVVVAEPAERDAGDRVHLAEVEPEELEVGDGGDAVGPVREVGAVVAVEVEHREAEDLAERRASRWRGSRRRPAASASR